MAIQFRPRNVPSDADLEYLNARYDPVRFERTLAGDLLVTPPTGFETGRRNAELVRQLGNWNRRGGHGYVLESSTGISIGLNGAPDAGWLSAQRFATIPPDSLETFLGVPPEIVFELRSPSNSARASAARAGDWVAAGVGLAVVLDATTRIAVVHDQAGPGQPIAAQTMRIDRRFLPGASEDLELDLWAIFDP
jgi:Uma2 family endonuclease